LNEGKIESVYASDRLRIKELRLIAPSSFLNSFYPLLYNWEISTRQIVEIKHAQESWKAQGPGVSEVVSQLFSQIGCKKN
jgi:hypothetical protein